MLINRPSGITFAFTLLFLTFLCTCGRAPQKQVGPTTVAGTIRYQEDGQLLEASVSLEPVDSSSTAIYPTLFGTAMNPLTLAGPGRYRARRSLPFPTDLRLTAPCPDGPACAVAYRFIAPSSDSIPALIEKSKTLRFPVGSVPLAKDESLVVFFEPDDRSAPRRLQLLGPSSSNFLTVRKEALSDIPAGKYQVYLVKQQLYKASSPSLVSSMQTEYFTVSRAVEVVE